MFRYRLILFPFVILVSCTNTELQKDPTIQGFSKRNISDHWKLQLPVDAKIGPMDSVFADTKKVTFPNDSLFIRYYYWLEDLDRNFDCSFSATVKRMKSGEDNTICQGDGSIHINYSPVINRNTQIAGWRGDWISDNRRFVVYLVYDCKTGEFLTLNFEGVDASKYDFIGEIIMSLEFQK